jgi:hypothetical protein
MVLYFRVACYRFCLRRRFYIGLLIVVLLGHAYNGPHLVLTLAKFHFKVAWLSSQLARIDGRRDRVTFGFRRASITIVPSPSRLKSLGQPNDFESIGRDFETLRARQSQF